MANVKLTAKTELTSIASGDVLHVVDVSDTTDGANGTSKKITKANLVTGLATTDITGLTSGVAELNILDGATLDVTELNHVDGVTSAIQTQIDTKSPTASPTFTGTVTVPTPFTIGAVSMTATGTELNVLDGIPAGLTATELGYSDGVTSSIQTQLNLTKRVYKSADETVNASSTLQDDDELTFAIAANEVWEFSCVLAYVSNTTADIKFQFSLPSGATMNGFASRLFSDISYILLLVSFLSLLNTVLRAEF